MKDHVKEKEQNSSYIRSLMDSIQQQETYERKKRKEQDNKVSNNWKLENYKRRQQVERTDG